MANLWYLSPSSQYENIGINGYGAEADQMNLLMDEIIPHLDRCGVSFHRADPDMSIQEKCAESDRMGAEWYFAMHSNAGGSGRAWGPVAFHGADTTLANRLVQELLSMGQASNRSSSVTDGTHLYEVRVPRAKACLLEVDFHDSEVGVKFLTERRSDAARAIARAIAAIDGKQWVEESGSDGPSPWAKPYTDEASALGIFTGDGNGNYRWLENITREEAAVILMRLKKRMEGKTWN